MVEVEIIGKEEAMQIMKMKTKEFKEAVDKNLFKAAIFMQGEVKDSIAGHRAELTSVDTGRFLNSISFQVKEGQAIVFTDVPYAKFLEYGTSNIEARNHFRNSVARNKEEVIEILKKAHIWTNRLQLNRK